MTEEIIIDGVNVVGCKFYTKNNCNCSIFWTPCEELDTCYYKQLKRLEQENDALKSQLDFEVQSKEVIDELEQENKELKEWKDKVVKLFETACRCKYLNEETDICSYTNEKCININKCVYKYQELSGAYRSALEEINRALLGVRGLSINCDKQIIKVKAIINEVLGDN